MLFPKDWNELYDKYDWVRDMHGVPQDPRYHAEGDVATHTQMVIKALEESKAFQDADSYTQDALWTSALLHDVEKRSTTKIEPDGSIVSPSHAVKGALTARRILLEMEVPFNTRESIVGLVRYHGLPIWLMKKSDPLKSLLECLLITSPYLLHTLSTADFNGRISDSKDSKFEAIDFFLEYAKEQMQEGTGFVSDLARYHYFNTPGSYRHYEPFDKPKCTALIISGLPGMGKDYYAKSLMCPVISIDDIRREFKIKPTDESGNGRAVQIAKRKAREFLRAGTDFAWNATNITVKMRKQLVDLFVSYGAKVEIVYIERPFSVWRKQNTEREHPIPNAVLDHMLSKLEVPTHTEAHHVYYWVEGKWK